MSTVGRPFNPNTYVYPLTHLTHVFLSLTSKCETLYMKYCMINSPKRKEDFT